MKILQLTRDYSRNGGIGSYVRDATAMLARAGHRVGVVYSEGAPGDGAEFVETAPGFDEFDGRHSAGTRERVMAVVASFGPDVVLVHAMDDFALEDALRESYAVARFVHNHVYCSSGLDYNIGSLEPCTERQGQACVAGFVSRRCWRAGNPITASHFWRRAAAAVTSLRSAAAVLTASTHVRNRVIQHGVSPDRIVVAPYFPGVPGTAADLLRPRPAGKLILFVGRILPEKGLDYLLRALARVPGDWRLLVNGDGPGLAEARTLARRLGFADRVNFAGWSDREQLLHCYEAADVVVLPSVWPEPFGLVGIEAMSYGKPVVAFRSGGIPDWLADGETGYLASPGDEGELGARIDELLSKPELRYAMGQAAIGLVTREFSPARHYHRLMDALESARRAESQESARSQTARAGA